MTMEMGEFCVGKGQVSKYIVASNLGEQTPDYGSEPSDYVYNKLFASDRTPSNKLL